MLVRVRELDVSADAPASNVSVVDRAAPPLFPSSPKKLPSFGLAALLGLTGGIGLAFLLESFDDGLRSAEQVERELQLPSFALVPDFNRSAFRAYGSRAYGERIANGVAAANGNGNGHKPAVAAANGTRHNREVFSLSGQNQSPIGEIYHSIRNSLLFSRAGSPPKTMVVTSAVEGEGKTVTATNVALALAQSGSRVLLVDADMRKARCHEVLEDGESGRPERVAHRPAHDSGID